MESSQGNGKRGAQMSTTERLCPVCDRVISPEAAVALLHGEVLHKECYEVTVGARKPPRPRRNAGRDGDGQP